MLLNGRWVVFVSLYIVFPAQVWNEVHTQQVASDILVCGFLYERFDGLLLFVFVNEVFIQMTPRCNIAYYPGLTLAVIFEPFDYENTLLYRSDIETNYVSE